MEGGERVTAGAVPTGSDPTSGIAPAADSVEVHNDGPSKLAFRIGLLVLVLGALDMFLQALRLSVPELLNIAGIAFGHCSTQSTPVLSSRDAGCTGIASWRRLRGRLRNET